MRSYNSVREDGLNCPEPEPGSGRTHTQAGLMPRLSQILNLLWWGNHRGSYQEGDGEGRAHLLS